MYYFLLCAVLLFPFIYVSGITKRKSKKKGSLLKSSDVETLSQYLLNLCMSLTLGIRSSPIPFLITSFIVLSVLLVNSFIEGSSNISCKHMTWKKINNILHKLTFWMYNAVFLAIYVIGLLRDNDTTGTLRDNMNISAYYCSIACLVLFFVGGCHEMIEFACTAISFIFKFFS